MWLLGLGIALIVAGLLITFSNLFGFALAPPLATLGATLILAGIALGVVGAAQGRRPAGRVGPGRPL